MLKNKVIFDTNFSPLSVPYDTTIYPLTAERRTRSRLSKNSSSEVTSSSSGNNETVSSEDIESLRKAPYGDKLADLELELCVRIPLFPQYYLAVKEALVR
jgi:hypothetical protein